MEFEIRPEIDFLSSKSFYLSELDMDPDIRNRLQEPNETREQVGYANKHRSDNLPGSSKEDRVQKRKRKRPRK